MHMHPAFCLMAPWWLALTAGAASAADIAAGKARAEICVGCHGANGISQIGNAQREDYLLQALRDYKSGVRAGGQAVMADVAYPLSDEKIEALAHYLAHR